MVKTFARFSVFARGRIVGKAEEGAKEKNIQSSVKKTNGKRGSLRAIRAIIKHSRDDPEYEGVPRQRRGAVRRSLRRTCRGRIKAAHPGRIEAASRPRGRANAPSHQTSTKACVPILTVYWPYADRPTDCCKNCTDHTDHGLWVIRTKFSISTVSTVCTIFTTVSGPVSVRSVYGQYENTSNMLPGGSFIESQWGMRTGCRVCHTEQ